MAWHFQPSKPLSEEEIIAEVERINNYGNQIRLKMHCDDGCPYEMHKSLEDGSWICKNAGD